MASNVYDDNVELTVARRASGPHSTAAAADGRYGSNPGHMNASHNDDDPRHSDVPVKMRRMSTLRKAWIIGALVACVVVIVGVIAVRESRRGNGHPGPPPAVTATGISAWTNAGDFDFAVESRQYPEAPGILFITKRGGGLRVLNVSDPGRLVTLARCM